MEVFDVKGPFFFGAVEQFKDQVLETLEHDTKVVILRMRLVPALDATGLNVLSDFCHQCREHGSTLLVCGVQPQPLDVIRHAPFYRELKRYNICENIDAALNGPAKSSTAPRPNTCNGGRPPVRSGSKISLCLIHGLPVRVRLLLLQTARNNNLGENEGRPLAFPHPAHLRESGGTIRPVNSYWAFRQNRMPEHGSTGPASPFPVK